MNLNDLAALREPGLGSIPSWRVLSPQVDSCGRAVRPLNSADAGSWGNDGEMGTEKMQR